MDAATSIVEAYLHANGYLTVTEYPIVEAVGGGGYRMVTDIDILAVRLPGAGRIVTPSGGEASKQPRLWEPDRNLVTDRDDERTDFIIAEVKEGKAELNRGARSSETLITAIRRFAFVKPAVAERLARQLLHEGRARMSEQSVQIRLVAFGSRRSDEPGTPNVILLDECLRYLVHIWRECAGIAASVQVRHPVPQLLTLLSKAGLLTEKPPRERPTPARRPGKR